MNIAFINTAVFKYPGGGRVNRQAYVQVWQDEKPVTHKTFENLTTEQYGRFQSLQNRIAASSQTRAIYAENDGSPDEIANGRPEWN